MEFKSASMPSRQMSRLNKKTSGIPPLSRAQGLLICITVAQKYRFTSFLSNNFVGLQVIF